MLVFLLFTQCKADASCLTVSPFTGRHLKWRRVISLLFFCNRKAELLTYFQTQNNLPLRFLSFIFTHSQAINQSSAKDFHHSLRRIDRFSDEIIYIMNCRYVDKRKRLLPDFIILFGSMVVALNSYFIKQRDNDTMSLSVFIEPWRAS